VSEPKKSLAYRYAYRAGAAQSVAKMAIENFDELMALTKPDQDDWKVKNLLSSRERLMGYLDDMKEEIR
jgi:hypothetical protein